MKIVQVSFMTDDTGVRLLTDAFLPEVSNCTGATIVHLDVREPDTHETQAYTKCTNDKALRD